MGRRQPLVLGQVPVEPVQLEARRQVDEALDRRGGEEVAGAVQHDAAPPEAGTVDDAHRGHAPAGGAADELQQRLPAVEGARRRRGGQLHAVRGDRQAVAVGRQLGGSDDAYVGARAGTGDGRAAVPGGVQLAGEVGGHLRERVVRDAHAQLVAEQPRARLPHHLGRLRDYRQWMPLRCRHAFLHRWSRHDSACRTGDGAMRLTLSTEHRLISAVSLAPPRRTCRRPLPRGSLG